MSDSENPTFKNKKNHLTKILNFLNALKDENAFYQKVYQVLTEPDRVNKKAQNVVFTALFRDTDYEYGGKIPQAYS